METTKVDFAKCQITFFTMDQYNLELGKIASGGLIDGVRGGRRESRVGNSNVDLSFPIDDLLGDEMLPLGVSLRGDLEGKSAVLGFIVVSKGVGGLSIGNLVITQESEGGLKNSREELLDIREIIDLRSEGIANVNNQNLPIGFSFINHSVSSQDLDLSNLSNVILDGRGQVADIKGIIVT